MLKIIFFIFLISSVISNRALGQASGNISIEVDTTTSSIINEIKNSDTRTLGFRVQLTSESGNGSQQRANAIRNKYLSRHKEHSAYLIWESPNFKVRIGDFKTKFEAAAYWKTLQYEFPNSYVVEDKIGGSAKKSAKSE